MSNDSAVLHGNMTRITRELEAQRSLINKLEKTIKESEKEAIKVQKKHAAEIDKLTRLVNDLTRKGIQTRQDITSLNESVSRAFSKR
jgi:septal ring factor EnvC (AmiA/AmiB activator)